MADPLIDLSDLLPKDMQADAKRRLTIKGKPPIDRKVVAKKYKHTPFKESIYPKPKPEPQRQVVFYDFYVCRCARAWHVPRWGSQIFNHTIDSRLKSHYTPAVESDELPHDVVMQTHEVSCCPACFHTMSDDPVIERMFQISHPEQRELDFYDRDWGYTYPASQYPLMVIS